MTKNEVDGRTATLAGRQYGVVSREQAMSLGLTPGMIKVRLRTGRWQETFPRVYRIGGAPASWRQSLMAATLSCEGSAASHASAAALWALPDFAERPVEVIVARGGRRSALFTVHRATNLIASDLTRVGPIPATTVARTLIDLSATTAEHRLESSLDDAARRGLITPERLLRRIAMLGRGHAGLRALRDIALDRAGLNATPHSVAESLMLQILRSAGLPDPRLQYRIGRAVVDFAYPEARLVIEVDGYAFHGADRGRWQSDLARQNMLIANGWRVVRFTWEDLTQRPEQVVAVVAEMLQERVNR